MPTPTEHAWRETWAFLRGPVGVDTFAFGTVDAYRNGVQHAPLLQEFPEPSDNSTDAFGIQAGGGFTVEIADELVDNDWYLLQEDFSRIVLEDGSGALIMEY
jgi:hypothetical protein